MSHTRSQDWDPKSAAVLRDERAAFDEMRERCPVAYSDLLGWSLFRHEDIVRVLNDHITFSSVVSKNLSVPNGTDPPEHGPYRRVIERYFASQAMQVFEPQCRSLAADLVRSLYGRAELKLMSDFAHPFAARVQCAFLGCRRPGFFNPTETPDLISKRHNTHFHHAAAWRRPPALRQWLCWESACQRL